MGPHVLAWETGLARSTVYALLRREGLSRLDRLEPRPPVVRYERERPGRARAPRHQAAGTDPPSAAVIASTVVAKAIPPRDRLEPGARRGRRPQPARLRGGAARRVASTTAGFLRRAWRFYAGHGITVERILTDNGGCYRSRDLAEACDELGIGHRFTRPYRPQTNGKAERMVRTLLSEWAYARPFHNTADRIALLPVFLDFYNRRRPHWSLSGQPPISRTPVGLHPQLFEVEVALDPAEDVVGDRAALEHLEQRLPLRLDDRARIRRCSSSSCSLSSSASSWCGSCGSPGGCTGPAARRSARGGRAIRRPAPRSAATSRLGGRPSGRRPPRGRRPGPPRPQAPDQERQGQPLADERREDDGERQEDHQVADREGVTRRRYSGSASAAASDTTPRIPAQPTNEHVARRRVRLALADPGAEQPRQIGAREDPDDPDHDHGRGDRDGQPEQLPGRVLRRGPASTDRSCSPIRMNTGR